MLSLARASGDDWQPAPISRGASSGVTASRAAAYAQLLDPVLAILGCAPGSAASTQLLRSLLRTSDPLSLARGVASELDEEVFSVIRKCWIMVSGAALYSWTLLLFEKQAESAVAAQPGSRMMTCSRRVGLQDWLQKHMLLPNTTLRPTFLHPPNFGICLPPSNPATSSLSYCCALLLTPV